MLERMRKDYNATPTEFRVSETQLRNTLHTTISSVDQIDSLYNGLPKTIAGAVIVFQTPGEAAKGRWELVGRDKDGKEVMLTGPY